MISGLPNNLGSVFKGFNLCAYHLKLLTAIADSSIFKNGELICHKVCAFQWPPISDPAYVGLGINLISYFYSLFMKS